ncbi:MAG: VanZ family protein [Dorea sp.]|nr:VanZ family protein [Dorea sp.]
MININDETFSPEYLVNAAIIFIPIFIVLVMIRIIKCFRSHINIEKELIIFSFLYYIYKVFDLTVFPIFWFVNRKELPSYGQLLYFEKAPLLLFSNFNYYTLYNVIGNMLLFLPMGFYMGIFIKEYNMKKNIRIIFLMSLAIECTQLIMSFFYFGNRIFDVNDLLFNTIGGVIGYLLYVSPVGKYIAKLYTQ